MLLVGGIYVASLEGFAMVIIFGIIFNKKFILSADDLLVLGYEHISILLYGNLFNTMTFWMRILRDQCIVQRDKFQLLVTHDADSNF